MDLRGPLPEDIVVDFGLGPFALPYTRYHGHMEFCEGVILHVRYCTWSHWKINWNVFLLYSKYRLGNAFQRPITRISSFYNENPRRHTK